MLGDPRRHAFDQKVLAWMTEGSWEKDDARFNTLACELFEFQFTYCTGTVVFVRRWEKRRRQFHITETSRGAYVGLQRSASSQL